MLTLNGYRVLKATVDAEPLRKTLTVKPFIPSVFVANKNAVPRYKVYKEVEDALYLPKHFGIETFGPPTETTRDVAETDAHHWTFTGSLRPVQEPVVNAFLKPTPHDGILSLHTGGGKTVCALYIASQLRVPTLVIVHNSFLRDQWVDRVKSFLPHARIGRIQGDVCEVEGFDIVIAMLQTLSMKETPIATFKTLGLIIVDECHHISAKSYQTVLSELGALSDNGPRLLGVTATLDRAVLAAADLDQTLPCEDVVRDYFPHLSADKFLRKTLVGEIKLPVVRIDPGTQKTAKGVHLTDGTHINCEAVAMSGGWSPVVNLACHRGAKPTWNQDVLAFLPPDNGEAFTVAGSAAGREFAEILDVILQPAAEVGALLRGEHPVHCGVELGAAAPGATFLDADVNASLRQR